MTANDLDAQAQADLAADLTEQFLAHLHAAYGIPPAALLAGAHAAIVTTMARVVGGPATAASCERAANRLRNVPSCAATALAMATPAGTA